MPKDWRKLGLFNGTLSTGYQPTDHTDGDAYVVYSEVSVHKYPLHPN